MIKDYPDSQLVDCTPVSNELTCVPNQEKGALKKKILIEGTGDSVAENGQVITFNYICTYQDGTLIDSSYERGRPLTVVLGNGQLILGLEYSLQTMKKGEKSFFKIRPCLNFTTTSEKSLNLPENRTLLFEIELIDWKPVDLSPEYDESVLKTQLKKGDDEFINPKAGRQITAYLIGKLSDNKTVFDEREVTFTLYENAKENNICLGVELCILSMKRNEKANVKIKRNFAFNDIPDEFIDKLPSDYEEIYYEIHLKAFELEKDVWEMSFDERFEEAFKSKQKGTEFFKQNKFDAAARHYQRIINFVGPDERHDFRERNAEKNELLKIAYLNLAQANLSMNKGLNAIHSADMAIKLDSTNVKGFYRRAMGYFKINDFDKAIEDFDMVLKMEPNNGAAKKQRSLCVQELKKLSQKEKKIFKNMFERLGKDDDNRRLIIDEKSDIFSKMTKDDEDYVKFKQELFTKPKDITP